MGIKNRFFITFSISLLCFCACQKEENVAVNKGNNESTNGNNGIVYDPDNVKHWLKPGKIWHYDAWMGMDENDKDIYKHHTISFKENGQVFFDDKYNGVTWDSLRSIADGIDDDIYIVEGNIKTASGLGDENIDNSFASFEKTASRWGTLYFRIEGNVADNDTSQLNMYKEAGDENTQKIYLP